MNFPYFISKRISQQTKGSFSSIISRIAVISITVAVASLLLSFMILLGFQNKIKEKIYSFSGHLVIGKYALSNSFEEASIMLNDTLRDQLNHGDIKHWQPYALKAGLLKAGDEIQGVVVKGVTPRQDFDRLRKHMVQGRMLEFDKENYSTEVVVSRKISKVLELELGEEVLIFFMQNPPRYRKLRVVGVYETGLEEFDENIIYGDLALIRRINLWKAQEVGGVEVFANDVTEIEAVQNAVFDRIGYDLFVEKVSDRYLQIFDWLSLLNRNVAIFLVLILFVAGFSMVSILLILIMERTQMVGIFKALGATNKLLGKIFLASGIQLILRGLIWGNLVAFSIGITQYYFHIIPLDAKSYYMDHVPIEFSIPAIFGVNLLVVILIGLSLYIPVNFIFRIDPIKSIRFD